MGVESDIDLNLVFGPESTGSTPEDRARSSPRIFVRSQAQLAEDTQEATGRRLSAWEALQSFGMSKLREVFEYGSAVLPRTVEEPARTLRARRDKLGLSAENLARITGLRNGEIEDAENPKTLTSIHTIEMIAQALALDERTISFVPGADGDPHLASRLKSLRSTELNSSLVSKLCEAAWVSRRQYDLFCGLHSRKPFSPTEMGFEPSSEYGRDAAYTAWMHGYWLAREARRLLAIAPGEPIHLRKLIEEKLEIPLIQFGLRQESAAGATVANGPVRGIAVNTEGANSNVWVRRFTLAHELGHLLYDPDERLERIHVDQYEDLRKDPQQQTVFVEARANAFAVEFLAPQKAAVEVFQSRGEYPAGLRLVMETFGISYTSARYHIWNGLDRQIPFEQLVVENYEPSDSWIGTESFTNEFFVPESVPESRRGKFACLVVEAGDANLLTSESAARYLGCSAAEYEAHVNAIRSICGMPDDTS